MQFLCSRRSVDCFDIIFSWEAQLIPFLSVFVCLQLVLHILCMHYK